MDHQDFEAGKKIDQFQIKYSTIKNTRSIKTLLEKMKPVISQKNEFE